MSKNPHAVALGRKGGQARSERKTAAVRANARQPRRPRRDRLERVSADLDTLCEPALAALRSRETD